MARQVRSEATRRKILDAAVEVFNEVGFAAADRGAIIERTGMTKGAFYHHFDSMESLASAIIEDGASPGGRRIEHHVGLVFSGAGEHPARHFRHRGSVRHQQGRAHRRAVDSRVRQIQRRRPARPTPPGSRR